MKKIFAPIRGYGKFWLIAFIALIIFIPPIIGQIICSEGSAANAAQEPPTPPLFLPLSSFFVLPGNCGLIGVNISMLALAVEFFIAYLIACGVAYLLEKHDAKMHKTLK